MAGESGGFNFDLHSLRRISFVGVTFRTRSAAQVEAINEKVTRALLPALSQGALRLPIDKVCPLEQAPEAFEHMARNQHFGKIVLANA
jgi:NADPH:quinone reductase